ncbi:DnaA regulatory inactivator Hda [Alloalcanivorax gelatiniphagus]|uniref:DnaA regulatory inactivator Hda n=1 Tax=Alloalcanivorax gelatiniphagus TaxID=1194167 RepID=A0ABY2XLH7_9GAMM|nr:DnaA regulatory inactivator Hda [Alloalcanivorax gelatiniphagus]TMW13053.1 DnaA regulatory inactivator Hda [Alloalcanivorax gelatiniphagus]|tara:strand:- start:4303 stop:4989 length:687 start_codon:yes stop_codon:yes gene_type:complete
MSQLPLALELREGHTLENFHAGPNGAALATVAAAADGDERQVFVWGGAGQGRSHLLEGAVRRAQEQGRDACLLPAGELLPLVPEVLESMEQFQLLALDDVDRFAGHGHWEEALFHLYNRVMAGGGSLLFSAGAAPGAAPWLLPDLATRLAAGPVFRLQPLSEESLAALLTERARERGLKLGAEVARFMVMRSERSPALLLERLAVLDRTALARQRAPTIPFIKDVFGW